MVKGRQSQRTLASKMASGKGIDHRTLQPGRDNPHNMATWTAILLPVLLQATAYAQTNRLRRIKYIEYAWLMILSSASFPCGVLFGGATSKDPDGRDSAVSFIV